MLEIIVLVLMGKYLHRTAKGKGWPGWVFVVLLILSWVVCGFGAAIAGVVITGDTNEEIPIAAIVGYLVGVAFACAGNAILVKLLPQRSRPDDFERDEEDEYDRRRRRRSRTDDDDDLDYDRDRPRRRRSDDDDR